VVRGEVSGILSFIQEELGSWNPLYDVSGRIMEIL
jgi:hypothetical protein